MTTISHAIHNSNFAGLILIYNNDFTKLLFMEDPSPQAVFEHDDMQLLFSNLKKIYDNFIIGVSWDIFKLLVLVLKLTACFRHHDYN